MLRFLALIGDLALLSTAPAYARTEGAATRGTVMVTAGANADDVVLRTDGT